METQGLACLYVTHGHPSGSRGDAHGLGGVICLKISAAQAEATIVHLGLKCFHKDACKRHSPKHVLEHDLNCFHKDAENGVRKNAANIRSPSAS